MASADFDNLWMKLQKPDFWKCTYDFDDTTGLLFLRALLDSQPSLKIWPQVVSSSDFKTLPLMDPSYQYKPERNAITSRQNYPRIRPVHLRAVCPGIV